MNLSIAVSPIEGFCNFAPFPLYSSPGGNDFDFNIRQAPPFQNKIQTVLTQPPKLAPTLSDKDIEIRQRRLKLKQDK